MATGVKKDGMLPPLLWRLLGALVVAALLAKWAWLLFAPRTLSIAPAPEQTATVEAGKLFGTAAAVVAPTPVSRGMETTLLPNARLAGIFAAESGRSGFAVLKLDDKRQVGVAAGQEVQPGIRLLEIHPGYVVLERNGVQQRVNLEENRREAPGKPEAVTYSPPATTNPASVVRYPAQAATNPAADATNPAAANPSAAVKNTPSATPRPGGLRRWED